MFGGGGSRPGHFYRNHRERPEYRGGGGDGTDGQQRVLTASLCKRIPLCEHYPEHYRYAYRADINEYRHKREERAVEEIEKSAEAGEAERKPGDSAYEPPCEHSNERTEYCDEHESQEGDGGHYREREQYRYVHDRPLRTRSRRSY